MSVHIIPFDSASPELREAAHEFCKRELTLPAGDREWDLSRFFKAWIEVTNNKSNPAGVVTGVTALLHRVDIAVYRSTTARGNAKLNQRLHSYLADQGLMGQDVLIHLSEKTDPSQMCANWEAEIKKAGIRPAERYLVRVKPI